jgi:hypothetical protein
MPTVLLLLALNTEPSLSHQELAQLCPPTMSAATIGAPLRCVVAAQQKQLTDLTRALDQMQKALTERPYRLPPE